MRNKQPGGRVGSVTRKLEEALLDGTFPANSKLPSERELAERYAVSRNTVREAIQQLGARGLVQIRPRSGVFVSDELRTGATSPWGQLIADSPARREDILEFRRVLEGATAYFAALRGTDEDLERIRSAMARLDQARRAGNHAVGDNLCCCKPRYLVFRKSVGFCDCRNGGVRRPPMRGIDESWTIRSTRSGQPIARHSAMFDPQS